MTKTLHFIYTLTFIVGCIFPNIVLANAAELTALGKKSFMSDLGEKIFYRTDPELMDKVAFTKACNKHEGSTALGCFNGRKIFLFKIPEPQLEYMISVTAAHEMLHAAYDRLDKEEREKTDKLLLAVQKGITDADILEKIEDYRKRDASILPSELHSIIGTEILNLPSELEAHYLKYFLNRKALVRLSENYYQDLQARKVSLKNTDSRLDELKKDIELRAKILRTKQSHLNVLKREIDEEASRERIENFNTLATQFNRELKIYEQMIANYNALAKERNSRAKENKILYQALDSKI
ncbi:hypothetical protein AZI86_14600 [Bdellovibrio bacteriovorus]|uniref:Uncharacterized protein n=1 Tax=Bdellovibrio bacteriovorus TaxID=959 RepID=A0A150WK22_BDEBC|nr:hypothetical protein [Bdellovibrio bacteriovorus]KYG64034.1 hypothetical protein AZI86_14600 [Bdellovibrio bacteriovorus]